MVAIGIDLGTTYSCVGWWKDNRCEIIANDQGNRTTPSYVSFNDNERLIGDGAKNQSSMNPTNTVYDAKRLIGRKYNDKVIQNEYKDQVREVQKKYREKMGSLRSKAKDASKFDVDTGEELDRIEFSQDAPDPHGLSIKDGELWYSDAAFPDPSPLHELPEIGRIKIVK